MVTLQLYMLQHELATKLCFVPVIKYRIEVGCPRSFAH